MNHPLGGPLQPQPLPVYHEGQVNNKLVVLAKFTPFLMFLGVTLFFGGAATTAWAYNTPDSDFFRHATKRERTTGPIMMMIGIVILLVSTCMCVYMRKKGVHIPVFRRNVGPRYISGGMVVACPVPEGTTAQPYSQYPPQANMAPFNTVAGYTAPPGGYPVGVYPAPPSGGYQATSGYPAPLNTYQPAASSGYPATSSGYPVTSSAYPGASSAYPAVSGAYPAVSGAYPATSSAYPPSTSEPNKTFHVVSNLPSNSTPGDPSSSPPFNPHYAPSQPSSENPMKTYPGPPQPGMSTDFPPPYSQDKTNFNVPPPPYSACSEGNVQPQNLPYSPYYTSVTSPEVPK